MSLSIKVRVASDDYEIGETVKFVETLVDDIDSDIAEYKLRTKKEGYMRRYFYAYVQGENHGNKGVLEKLGKERALHKIIASRMFGDITGKAIHHKNKNSLDNRRENLEIFNSIQEHKDHHRQERSILGYVKYLELKKENPNLDEKEIANTYGIKVSSVYRMRDKMLAEKYLALHHI